MKKNLLLILFAFSSGTAFGAADAENAVTTVHSFVEALRVHDYGKMVSLLPPPFVKAQGGKEKLIAAHEAAKVTADVIVESSAINNEPELIPATDAVIYFVKADLFSRYKKQKRIVAHTFYVAFRWKDRTDWFVMDGSKFDDAQLRKIFRGLPETLSLPRVSAEIIPEQPNKSPEPTPTRGTPRPK